MASAFGNLSGSGPQQVWLEMHYVGYSQAGNYSTWYCELRYYGNGWGSWSNTTWFWSLSGFAAASGTFSISSAHSHDTYTLLFSSYFTKPHDANGYLASGVLVGAISTDHSTVGSGSVGVTADGAPRIPKPSQPMNPVGLDQFTPTSMRYMFSASGVDLGGGVWQRWEARYSKNPDMSGGIIVPSSGTTVQNNLDPGSTYYWDSRAVTADGSTTLYGAWSTVLSGDTLAGILISNGVSWIPTSMKISDGISWSSPLPQISDGSAWTDPIQI